MKGKYTKRSPQSLNFFFQFTVCWEGGQVCVCHSAHLEVRGQLSRHWLSPSNMWQGWVASTFTH